MMVIRKDEGGVIRLTHPKMGEVVLTVLQVTRQNVRLGITAPQDVRIDYKDAPPVDESGRRA